MPLFRRAPDDTLFELLEDGGRNVERATQLLRDLLAVWPERPELVAEVVACEQEGDRITHDIIHRIDGTHTGRAPFDAGDGHALATALDDIVDFAEQTADALGLYGVEAPMEQSGALADVLVGAGAQVALALRCLRSGSDLQPHLVEIHRLENEGDRLERDALASLFEYGTDPMLVIRWKDLFERLEEGIDATERVANVLQGLSTRPA